MPVAGKIMHIIFIQIIFFAGCFGAIIHFYFELRRKMKVLANEYGIFYLYECKKCGRVKAFSYNESLIIMRKPRNVFIKRIDDRVVRQVREYRFHCENCGRKHYQRLLLEQSQIPEGFRVGKSRLILRFAVKCGIVVPLAITGLILTEKFQ